MSDTAMSVARDALNVANAARSEIDSHEQVCAERYNSINAQLGPDGEIRRQLSTMWKIFAWGGLTAFTTIMGMLAFLTKATYENITATQRAALTVPAPQLPPQIIIQPPAGTQPMGARVEPKTPTS